MNDSQTMWHLYKYKEKEWLREIENHRLRQQRRSGPKVPNPVFCFLINKAGDSMGSWGLSLRERCEAAA